MRASASGKRTACASGRWRYSLSFFVPLPGRSNILAICLEDPHAMAAARKCTAQPARKTLPTQSQARRFCRCPAGWLMRRPPLLPAWHTMSWLAACESGTTVYRDGGEIRVYRLRESKAKSPSHAAAPAMHGVWSRWQELRRVANDGSLPKTLGADVAATGVASPPRGPRIGVIRQHHN